MTNNKKYSTKEAKTNREYFYILKNDKDLNLSDNVIYQILIACNDYKNYTELVINFDKNLAKPKFLEEIISKLKISLPLQYAIGYTYFLDCKIYVNKNTLIPREETKELVLNIEKMYKDNNLKEPSLIIDYCAGTGCIGISLNKIFPSSHILFVEKYAKTIKVLEKNIKENETNAEILRSSTIKPLLDKNVKCDLFVSNPPYVDNMDSIEPSVKNNEPLNAIYVKNGTKFHEMYFKYHSLFLTKEYLMSFEIGEDQELKLTELIKKYFKDEVIKYSFRKDMYGKTRFLFISNFLGLE